MRTCTRSVPLRPWVSLSLVLLCGVQMADAAAWSINIGAASRRVFLHVGNGAYDATNTTINQVEVSVTGAQLIAGGALPMTSNSSQSRSLLDNFLTCPNTPSQLLIGASYRRSNNNDGPANATLSVTAPVNLSNGSDTIPFSEISWTVAAPGSGVPNVIAAGTFNGAQQTLATIPANRYVENCHSFTYANSAIRAAGTYTGQVTYTMTSP